MVGGDFLFHLIRSETEICSWSNGAEASRHGVSFCFLPPYKIKMSFEAVRWPLAKGSVSPAWITHWPLVDFSVSVWLGSVDSMCGAVCVQEVVSGDFRLVVFIICSIGCWNPSCTTSRPVIQTSLHLTVHICREGVPTSQTFLEESIYCERKKKKKKLSGMTSQVAQR